MATSLASSRAAIIAAFTTAAPAGVDVRRGRPGGDAYNEPIVCTVGVMDDATDIREVSSPMSRIDRAPMGGTHTHDMERLAIFCSLTIPGDGEATPDSAIDVADNLIGVFAASLQPGNIPGAYRAWLSDVLIFELDTSTGFGAAATFTVYVESFQ